MREPLPCRESPCDALFLGGTDKTTIAFRKRHESVVHGLVFEDPKEPGLPYQRHSATSLSAAQQLRVISREQRERVYRWLRKNGPATDLEIQEGLALSGDTERPRRIELVNEKRVRDAGKTRRTRSGREATIWEVIG